MPHTCTVLARFRLCVISQTGPPQKHSRHCQPGAAFVPCRDHAGFVNLAAPAAPRALGTAGRSPGRQGQGAGCGRCALLAGGPRERRAPSRGQHPPVQRVPWGEAAWAALPAALLPAGRGHERPRGWRRRRGDLGGSAAAGPPGSSRAPVAAAGG